MNFQIPPEARLHEAHSVRGINPASITTYLNDWFQEHFPQMTTEQRANGITTFLIDMARADYGCDDGTSSIKGSSPNSHLAHSMDAVTWFKSFLELDIENRRHNASPYAEEAGSEF